MSLDLKTIRTRGRASSTPLVLATRALSAAELEARSAREVGIQAAPLKRLQSRHRDIARELASGATTSEVAAKYGITASRVSVLKSDPSFQDLIHYFTTRREEARDYEMQELRGLHSHATSTLIEVFEDDEQKAKLDPEFVLKVMKETADRIGLGPSTKQETNVNINFGDRLDAARKRVLEAQSPTIIEGELINE